MSNVNISGLPIAVGLDGNEYVPIVQSGTTKRVTTAKIGQVGQAAVLPGSIEFLIDGNGGVISARTWGYLTVPFNAALTSAELFSDQTGTIIVNVWKCTYAQFDAGVMHPTAADSITGGNPPTITNSTKYRDTSLGGWTVTLTKGDILAFNVPDVAVNITRVTLSLNLTRIVS